MGYAVLYSFAGYPSGDSPTGLIELDGEIYGTTIAGGASTFGTVFARKPSGNVHVLYAFKGGTDGASPEGNLVAFNGALYGTTEYGGIRGDGTVFEMSRSGRERVIYAFKGGADGAMPVLAGLVVRGGALYGTTYAGGDSTCEIASVVGCGTVFEVRLSGKERVLHRFRGKSDGAGPVGSLLDVAGSLYGTTNFGGLGNNGTVYKLTTTGNEKVLYRFKGYPDGVQPYAGLTLLHGALYGTTALGGAFDDSGTVFELTTTGIEHQLHSFRGYPDGALPYDALTVVGGQLYGSTVFGGTPADNCAGGGVPGCGTVFAITTSGKERVLYRFKGKPDGENPWSSLIFATGDLYGTTVAGGANGKGSIFRIAAPSQQEAERGSAEAVR